MKTTFPLARPLSECAFELVFGSEPDPATRRLLEWVTDSLQAAPFPGLSDLTPAYTSLTIHFDPRVVSAFFPESLPSVAVSQLLQARATEALDYCSLHLNDEGLERERPPIEIPVRYGDQWGIDLPEVAERLGLSESELVEQHCGSIYTVFMLGFLPGFPYLGILPKALQLPRRSSPRPLVPAGSVAIAGQQTGIYPQASPGGWHLIGQMEVRLFDAGKQPPALLQVGCRVRFVPV